MRPTKGDEARNKQICVYVTKNEFEEIEKIAAATNRSRADIVYNLYKKGEVIIINKQGLSANDLRLLAIANNNLNQIARQINTSRQTTIDISTLEVLKLVGETLAKIRPE